MEYGEAEKHTQECLVMRPSSKASDADGANVTRQKPGDLWGDEAVEVVERRAREVARYREWVM